ncbi:MAG: 2Fe-2S iron-sulfur cluster binding domain-containing protein, partial [Neisseriaceae bacterium]|nr:2Fe-2S iron-sulfur cluster binding domain-containing protein [Neisseriaceae bacterium]
MTYKINVLPSQTEFNSEEQQSLLSAALSQGINLPHACQNGVCG